MKFIILLSVIFALTAHAENKTVTLTEVAEHVKAQNFEVLKNAQRVYQAKETINFSKRNLLPKLNLWRIISSPFDWRSAIGLVGDIAPFLVPNNWLRVKQSEVLYEAQKEQYRALWANEIMTAKLLYVNTLRDIEFKSVIQEQQEFLDELIHIVETRQVFGDVPPQVIKLLKIRKLHLSEDLRVLDNLVFEEHKALAFIMGIDQDVELSLESIELPNIEDLKPIQYETFVFRAISSSPEIAQFEHIQKGLKYIKKEVWFSFLGASSASRGINGGVFDHIPIQDGLDVLEKIEKGDFIKEVKIFN